MSSIENAFKDFMDDIKEDVVEAQKEVAHTAMDNLFLFSPHYISGYGGEARSMEKDKVFNQQVKDSGSDPKDYSLDHTGAEYAEGTYDINHKISSNNQKKDLSNVFVTTYSYNKSENMHDDEASKIDEITEIGDDINISNVALHAFAVETGIGWEATSGYQPYQKAISLTKAIHKDVLT
jgi:hypothetical protein